MPRQFFGTDGIRGVAGVPPLDDATLFALGLSVAEYLHRDHSSPHALIGTDTRESGPHIAAVVAAGLLKGGASVSFAGVLTTPGVACLVRRNDFHVGVVVSASHNPYQDNGVKLFSHEGMKFPDTVEEEIEAGILKHRTDTIASSLPNLKADDSRHQRGLAQRPPHRSRLCQWRRLSAWSRAIFRPWLRHRVCRRRTRWPQH